MSENSSTDPDGALPLEPYLDSPDSLRERCFGLLDLLREGSTYPLDHLLWLHDVALDEVRAREAAWRSLVGYEGASLLPPVRPEASDPV